MLVLSHHTDLLLAAWVLFVTTLDATAVQEPRCSRRDLRRVVSGEVVVFVQCSKSSGVMDIEREKVS